MARFFNTAGFCNPDKHYMVDPLRGLYSGIVQLIRQENYFLLHAPRQTGKTTLLHALAHRLNAEGTYTASVFSVKTAGVPSFTEAMANESPFFGKNNTVLHGTTPRCPHRPLHPPLRRQRI